MNNQAIQRMLQAADTNAELQGLLDLIQEFIVLKDAAGRWLVTNQTVLDTYELSGVSYKGKMDLELAELSPKYRAGFEYNLRTDEEAWAKGAPHLVEKSFAMADGSVQTWEVIKTPLFNEAGQRHRLIIVSRNVTERKRAEQALIDRERQYRLIAENMSDLICTARPGGEIRYCSPSSAHILGPTEYEGSNIWDMLHPEDRPVVKARLAEMHQTGSVDVQCRCRHADGRYIWFEACLSTVLDEAGIVDHIVVAARDITERKHWEERLQRLAYHDALTGVPNRRYFVKLVSEMLQEAEDQGTALALLYLDIDLFKQINDTLGHETGDELLVHFVRRIQRHLSSPDHIARIGGDEFVVVLPGMASSDQAAERAEDICRSLLEPLGLAGIPELTAGSSIGAACYPQDAADVQGLLRCADQALYQAKRLGRGRVCFYSAPLGKDQD